MCFRSSITTTTLITIDFKHLSGHLSSNSQDPLNKMQNIHFDAAKDIEEGSSAEDKLVQSGTGNEAKHRMSSKMFILRYQILPLVLLLVVDLAIPLAIYYIFRIFTTEIIALIVSGIPPLLRVVYILIRYRRIDILSCIFVVSFVVSGVLSIVNGKQRLCNRATIDNVAQHLAIVSQVMHALLCFGTLSPLPSSVQHFCSR